MQLRPGKNSNCRQTVVVQAKQVPRLFASLLFMNYFVSLSIFSKVLLKLYHNGFNEISSGWNIFFFQKNPA